MEGWVDLVDLITPQLGVELVTFRSRVRVQALNDVVWISQTKRQTAGTLRQSNVLGHYSDSVLCDYRVYFRIALFSRPQVKLISGRLVRELLHTWQHHLHCNFNISSFLSDTYTTDMRRFNVWYMRSDLRLSGEGCKKTSTVYECVRNNNNNNNNNNKKAELYMVRPIYGFPENFREYPNPTATFPEISNGLLFGWTMRMYRPNLWSDIISIEILGGSCEPQS